MPKEPFTDEQVDLAIDFVIEECAEHRATTRSYTPVFAAAGMDLPQDLYENGKSGIVYAFMERFHYRCRERGLPPLDALVINAAGPIEGWPGGGYFTINGQVDPFNERRSPSPEAMAAAVEFWRAQQRECYDWGVEH